MILTAYWISKSQFLLLVGQMEKNPQALSPSCILPRMGFRSLDLAASECHDPLSFTRTPLLPSCMRAGDPLHPHPTSGNSTRSANYRPSWPPCGPASIKTTIEPAPSSIVLSRDMSRPAHGLPAQQAPRRMRTLGMLALSPFSLTDGRTTRPADLPTLLA